ncbi:dephospho-CoA kinase [Luteimicrobium subarcticum]|uniref:Dephospho-CoA kinase n=1 Tax=Luteimicrobium subarcticum TaxID=620910 RepID=A0A2M8W3H7_9MICO|nr:dephospho-CoA kinase [Luteimicrobium subarcticum]PJI85449.1 dephospho-CoA kinase [Luteimicrobium subarcticum]
MFRVGLTGGIASGKSVVLAQLATLGATTVDHDQLARDVVRPGSVGLERVVDAFGDDVLAADGTLDRPALAAVVFAEPARREQLNAIVHPEIRRCAAEQEARAVAADPDAVVVHDIPLLVETGQGESFGLVLVVDAPRDLRLARLVESRGMSLRDAEARLDAQAPDDLRLAAADVVLDGSGDVEALRAQVDALWPRLVEEARAEEAAEE